MKLNGIVVLNVQLNDVRIFFFFAFRYSTRVHILAIWLSVSLGIIFLTIIKIVKAQDTVLDFWASNNSFF